MARLRGRRPREWVLNFSSDRINVSYLGQAVASIPGYSTWSLKLCVTPEEAWFLHQQDFVTEVERHPNNTVTVILDITEEQAKAVAESGDPYKIFLSPYRLVVVPWRPA